MDNTYLAIIIIVVLVAVYLLYKPSHNNKEGMAVQPQFVQPSKKEKAQQLYDTCINKGLCCKSDKPIQDATVKLQEVFEKKISECKCNNSQCKHTYNKIMDRFEHKLTNDFNTSLMNQDEKTKSKLLNDKFANLLKGCIEQNLCDKIPDDVFELNACQC